MRLSRFYLWLMAIAVVGGLALIINLFWGLGIVPGQEDAQRDDHRRAGHGDMVRHRLC